MLEIAIALAAWLGTFCIAWHLRGARARADFAEQENRTTEDGRLHRRSGVFLSRPYSHRFLQPEAKILKREAAY